MVTVCFFSRSNRTLTTGRKKFLDENPFRDVRMSSEAHIHPEMKWNGKIISSSKLFKVFPPYQRNRFCLSAVFQTRTHLTLKSGFSTETFPTREIPRRSICVCNWSVCGWRFSMCADGGFECVFSKGGKSCCMWVDDGNGKKNLGREKSESNAAHRKKAFPSVQSGINEHFRLFWANFLWVGIGSKEEVFSSTSAGHVFSSSIESIYLQRTDISCRSLFWIFHDSVLFFHWTSRVCYEQWRLLLLSANFV